MFKRKSSKNNIQYNNNNNMPGIFNAIKYKQEMTEPWKTVHDKLN